MKHYKNWGVSCGSEVYMMAHAERHRKELERERKVIQRQLPLASQAPLRQHNIRNNTYNK